MSIILLYVNAKRIFSKHGNGSILRMKYIMLDHLTISVHMKLICTNVSSTKYRLVEYVISGGIALVNFFSALTMHMFIKAAKRLYRRPTSVQLQL